MKSSTHHPINDLIISQEHVDFIRQYSVEMERSYQLTQPVLDLIYQQKWLNVMKPLECGGKGQYLPSIVRLFEALAYADGNVGWCVNLGAGANLFSGYLKKETAKQIFAKPKTWCAGSGAVSGRAYREKGGWRLSGKWKYASGAAHASHFTTNAYLFDEKNTAILENNQPAFRSFIFPAKSVHILNTWHTSGLKATSSHDFEVKEIFVPDTHIFCLTQPSEFAHEAIFKFPFDALAIINMACMITGMALHFLELFNHLMTTKKPLNATIKLGKQSNLKDLHQAYRVQFENERAAMYQALDKAWQPYVNGHLADSGILDHLSQKAKSAANYSRNMVQQLFLFCGMSIVFDNTELNKVWRDISVAGQHYLLSPLVYT